MTTTKYLAANLFDGNEQGKVTVHLDAWLPELTSVVDDLLAEARAAERERLREALQDANYRLAYHYPLTPRHDRWRYGDRVIREVLSDPAAPEAGKCDCHLWTATHECPVHGHVAPEAGEG